MCGFAVVCDPSAATTADELRATVDAMAERIRHRGPDDAGTWVDAEAGAALGFRRLAVLDLTPAAHQPMASSDGRYVVVFNGEIYNFEQLRHDLVGRGARFAGTGDSEVLVAAIQEWGVLETASRCNGMFAFAVWDRRERTLHLARDRFGEKPLYVGRAGRRLVAASELGALRAAGVDTELDRDVVALYLRLGYVPAPWSVCRGVTKVRPGVVLSLRAGRHGFDEEENAFWSPLVEARRDRDERARAGGDAVDELGELLLDAVRLRMRTDVPLGAFLSGGIDSSLVVAAMTKISPAPVRTFTIGFREASFDESGHAAAVARHLGTEHHELVLTASEALARVPELARRFDEPFGDPSALPTSLLAEFAREHVTVALSGDGGDELFGGYERYDWTEGLWRRMRAVPQPVRALAGATLRAVPSEQVSRAVEVLPERLRGRVSAGRIHRVGRLVGVPTPTDLYRGLVSHWDQPEVVVRGSAEPRTAFDRMEAQLAGTLAERMMLVDTMLYLPDDILVKVDRASMAVGLEARVPLLDPRIFRWAWRQPIDARRVSGRGKLPLRELLDRWVPRSITERPKMGFGMPVGPWLRGPLRAWAEDLLSVAQLARGDLFDPVVVRRAWDEHQAGHRDWSYPLWDVLMLQSWRLSTAEG